MAFRQRRRGRRESEGQNGALVNGNAKPPPLDTVDLKQDSPSDSKSNSSYSHSHSATSTDDTAPTKKTTTTTSTTSSSKNDNEEDDNEEDDENEEVLFRALLRPRVRYDVEVLTKLIVYAGIGWITAEGGPVLFEVVGLGVGTGGLGGR